MTTKTCQRCGKVNPPNHASSTNPDGSAFFVCMDCYRINEQRREAENAKRWDHEGATQSLLNEANRRNLRKIEVLKQTASGYLGTNTGTATGIRLSPTKTKGIGPFKKKYHFDLNLDANEIVGRWVIIPEAGTFSVQELFRIPISDTAPADSINRALTFIASQITL
jgi:hypothetical protein